MKSFMTRLISGIVLLAIIIGAGITGGLILFLFTLVISLIGYWEFCQVFQIEKKVPGILGLFASLLYYVAVYYEVSMLVAGPMLLITYLMVLMAVYVFTFPKYKTEEIMAAYFGVGYVSLMLSFLYQTRLLSGSGADGKLLFFLIFICSWGCDTCAYAVGMLIGKHKLAPVLSPKKSIEGAVGGVVGAALLGYLYGLVLQIPPGVCGVLCGVGAVVSQIGDLAASAIKRNHNIKDYGHLIPGHGGILDRFDSVIFTAPIIWILATWIMK
ncbi:MAG: phosphatidate cytidylyltransferase [Lachnospiraceae bacterium]|nr:phosphatidate cytidylyltransferase [Lachnospiraceae bacterium]